MGDPLLQPGDTVSANFQIWFYIEASRGIGGRWIIESEPNVQAPVYRPGIGNWILEGEGIDSEWTGWFDHTNDPYAWKASWWALLSYEEWRSLCEEWALDHTESYAYIDGMDWNIGGATEVRFARLDFLTA